MGRYVSWDEQLRRRKEWQNKHAEERKKHQKELDTESERLISQLRRLVKNCGLTQIQISDFSGAVPTSVSRFLKRRSSPKIQFRTVIAYLSVAGYRIKFEKLESKEDKFRDSRMFPPGTEY